MSGNYIFDANGSLVGFRYRGADYASGTWDTYAYEKNIQGDIIGVYDTATGNKLIAYKYNAWGAYTTSYYNSGSTTTATKNPFKYRGYYYDSDLGLYYLQSRYYDQNTCRFINADGYVSTGQGLTGYNMFAYCNNNPVMYVDHTGELSWVVFAFIAVGAVVGAVIGYHLDEKIEPNIEFEFENDRLQDVLDSENDSQDNEDVLETESVELTTGDRVKNALIVSSLGVMAVGTMMIIGGGVTTVLAPKFITTTIGWLGMTSYQLTAFGTLSTVLPATTILPLMGIEIENIIDEFPKSGK